MHEPPARSWTGVDVTPTDVLPTWDPFSWRHTLTMWLPVPVRSYVLVQLAWVTGYYARQWYIQFGRGLVRWQVNPNRLVYIPLNAITAASISELVSSYDPQQTCLLYVVDETASDRVHVIDIQRAGVTYRGKLQYVLPVKRQHASKYDGWRSK